MFRYIKSRVVLLPVLLALLLGVAAISYALPKVQGQSTNGEKLFVIGDEELQEHHARLETFFSFPRSAWECLLDALRPIVPPERIVLNAERSVSWEREKIDTLSFSSII